MIIGNLQASTISHKSSISCRKQATFPDHSAFTLVEMIVAISLASILILVTAMIFKQASSAFSEYDARNEVYQNVRAVFDMLKRDISGAALNANYELFKSFDNIDKNDYPSIEAEDKSDILTFLSGTPNLEDKPIALITYYLKTDNVLYKLEKTDTSILNSSINNFKPDEQTKYKKLGLNVGTFQLRYYDKDAVIKWKDTWDSTSEKYLPDAVEVKITISDTRDRFTETFTSRILILR